MATHTLYPMLTHDLHTMRYNPNCYKCICTVGNPCPACVGSVGLALEQTQNVGILLALHCAAITCSLTGWFYRITCRTREMMVRRRRPPPPARPPLAPPSWASRPLTAASRQSSTSSS